MRISVTDLDGYDFYRKTNMQIEEYVQRLRMLAPPTPNVQRGRDFHALLEQRIDMDGPLPSGNFDFSQVNVRLPRPDVTEMSVVGTFPIHGEELTLSGRVDTVCGLTVGDYKTTQWLNMEQFIDAWQWRAYLTLLPDMQSFRYDVFQISRAPSGSDFAWLVNRHEFMMLHRYEGMEDEVLAKVAEYTDFLRYLEQGGLIKLGPRGVVKG